MNVRVVVANESAAIFYDLEDPAKGLQFAGQISDPRARLHDRDLVTDRPGRRPDHAPLRSGRRGASPHHATGSEHDAHMHEIETFARQLVHELENARLAGRFDRLIIMAGPRFLGMLRTLVPASLKAALAAEVPKDLVIIPSMRSGNIFLSRCRSSSSLPRPPDAELSASRYGEAVAGGLPRAPKLHVANTLHGWSAQRATWWQEIRSTRRY